MSVDYTVTVLTNRLQVVANAIDTGVGGGFLRLLDNNDNILSSMRFYQPSGVAVGGVLTFRVPLIDGSVTTGGVATRARCEDANGVVVISGLTVNNSSSPDIILSPTNVLVAGQTVAITAASITGN